MAKYADGIAHSTRLMIIEILKKRGNESYLSDLVKDISKFEDYKNDFASVKGHCMKLHFAGIVELTQKDGRYFVRLLKDVEISIKDVNQ